MTSRADGAPAVAGITFGAGLLHQPTEQLGVLGMVGARLATGLSVPAEVAGAMSADRPVDVTFAVGQTDCSLTVVGDVAAVCAALRRVDELLAVPTPDEWLDSLRDRSLSYPNPLSKWSSHLAARWPGHRPHLSALGPHAVDSLSGTALTTFAARHLGPARRVYWTNEPSVAEVLGPPARGPAGAAAEDVLPAGWRDEPGCVAASGAGELYTIAIRQSPAARVAVTLLARTLHRRLVELEPLAADVWAVQHDLGGDLALICGAADPLPRRDSNDGRLAAAVAQTAEDLAAGMTSPAQLARAREICAGAARAQPHDSSAMLTLTRRQLRLGDFPTPDLVAAELDRVTDEQVQAALAEQLPQLLVAADERAAEGAVEPPFPFVDWAPVRAAEGRPFRDWIWRSRVVRCSTERVGIVESRVSGEGVRRRARPVTVSSVDFDEVVLRLDAADQQTTLVDRRLRSVRLAWGRYRNSATLRELVDRHTADVPVIRQPGDPEWPARLARAARRQRRRKLMLPVWGLAGLAVVVLLSLLIGSPPAPVTTTLAASEQVTLPNGTTLGAVGQPELIEHYDAGAANLYAVQLRMCGGEDEVDSNGFHEARNYFGKEKFTLLFGEQSARPRWQISERAEPRGDYVREGECAAGWVLFDLPEPVPTAPLTMRYTNIHGDDVRWRMPSDPPLSPLSRSCPEPQQTPLGDIEPVPWVGCAG